MTLGTCHSSTDERDKRPGKAHPPYQPRNTHKDTHAYATTQTVYKHPITHVSQTEILLLIIIHNLCYFFIDFDMQIHSETCTLQLLFSLLLSVICKTTSVI